jgi:hypothetical protein
MDPKEKLLLDAEWEEAVYDLQDSEKVHGVPPYETDLLCNAVMHYLQTHRVRDKLFWQRKGDEFHGMIESLPYSEERVVRIVGDDEFWFATLKLFGVVLPKNE